MSIASRERQRERGIPKDNGGAPLNILVTKPSQGSRGPRPKASWHKSWMYRASTAPNDTARTLRHRDGSPMFYKPMGLGIRLSDLLPHLA